MREAIAKNTLEKNTVLIRNVKLNYLTDALGVKSERNFLADKKDPRFSTENGVRLISCSTGQGKDCIAQQLANILQCEVKAPNDEIRVRPDGSYYIGYFGLGNWQIFTPKE